MKKISTFFIRRVFSTFAFCLALGIVLTSVTRSSAQESNLTCNAATNTNWVNAGFTVAQTNSGGGTAGLGGWTDVADVVNASTTDYAYSVFTGQTRSIRVTDATNDYNTDPTGAYYIGYHIGSGTVFTGNVTIKAYLNNSEVDTYTTPFTGAVGTVADIGFTTKAQFDAIEVIASGTGTFRIYNALIHRYCAGPALASVACNTPIQLNLPTYPVLIDDANTGPTGITIGAVSGEQNAVSASTTDFATLSQTVSTTLLGGSLSLAVKNPATTYPAGTFIGFDIENTDLLSIGLLNGIEVTGLLNGSAVTGQSATGGSLLLSAGALGSNGRQTIGFVTTAPVNGIKITLKSGLLAVSLGTTRVYNAVFEKFCAASPGLVCNTPTTVRNPTYPVYINAGNTGIDGTVSAASGVQNSANLVDADATNYASVVLPASVLVNASVSVKDQVTDYPAGYFAGFDIDNPTLIGASAASGIRIATYRDGNPTGESVANGSLVTAGTSVLTGTGRQTIGFVTTLPFDEVRLIIQQTASASLGTIRVYGAVLTKFSADCPATPLACNTLTPVTNPTYPVYVNGANTGFTSAACAGCTINNAQNVVDADAGNYASIVVTANAVGSASFAVANAIDTYAAGSFAGFHIETPTLLSANALNTATITLYNNGAQVQAPSPSVLIVGATTGLVNTGPNSQTLGVVANVPFDEVKISFTQVAGVDLGTVRIYNAIIQNSCSTVIACSNTYFLNRPTFPVVIDATNTGVVGAVGALATVNEPWNVVSASTTDFARITNTASALAPASIAVVDPVNTFPTGTFAGFTIRRATNLVTADLLQALTVTTYLDGVQQQSRSAASLLDLTLILQVFGTTPGDFLNVGFVTSLPFDEVKLSVGSLASVAALSGSIDVYGAFIDTRTSSGGGLACALTTNPDFSVTNKSVPVTGNVKTNDIVPVGTTYGPAPAPSSQPAGSSPSLTVNPDGTYSFSATTPGVYVYAVPVCGAGLSGTACATQTLTVTVLDPTITTNNPVANPDFAATTGAPTSPTAVTVNIRANDGPGNTGGTLQTPTIPAQPANGSASIVNGNLVYTPNAGFYGTDVVTYQVCETPGNLCSTATVTVTVRTPGSPAAVSINDDYVSTPGSTSVTGNVLTNDLGTGLTVSNPGTTVTSSGTLVVTSTGSYTFTPAPGVSGPVAFTYTACDNASTCGTATLQVLVGAAPPDLTPSQFFSNLQIGQGQTIDMLVAIRNVSGTSTSGEVKFAVTNYTPATGLTMVLNTDPSVTISGTVFPLNTSDFTVTSNSFAFSFTSVAGASGVIVNGGRKYVAFKITRSSTSVGGSVTNTATVEDGTGGGETPVNNNTISNKFFKP